MAPKRRTDETPESSARDRKRQKLSAARTIPVQTSSHSVGPSHPGVGTKDNLPSSIDVEKFVESRAFEINAMESAIKSSGEGSTHRAWQTLPRHLRRRAASHDVRRVPLRLREKARAEMDPVRKKSGPKLKKGKRISRTKSFQQRQRDKTWLETHLWHAKRMKMETRWGYRLAIHPTEKSFRPSHRAAAQGSIIHDASYYSFIELKGPTEQLRAILLLCSDPQAATSGAMRYTGGSRILETHFYRLGSYPFGHIGPVTIMWRPTPLLVPPLEPTQGSGPDSSTSPLTELEDAKAEAKQRKKRSKKTVTEPAELDPNAKQDTSQRTVWIRSHPSIFEEISTTLQSAVSLTLQAAKAKKTAEMPDVEIEMADLRGALNIFEIMGPQSSQVIRGALSPVDHPTRQEFSDFWSSLKNLQTTGSVPGGMIIGFEVYDPRLKFPPKNAKPGPVNTTPIIVLPSSMLAQCDIWEESIRDKLIKPRFTTKDLNDRRSKNLVPGTPLNAQRQDDRIPVMLIQRSVKSPDNPGEAFYGWTLIIPAGWSMAFFNSLIYTGTRVAGQRERQTQSFEAGVPYFPRDYPFASTYGTFIAEREEEEKRLWNRRPPAKRVNYEKLGVRSPWKPDWKVVLGIPQDGDDELLPTQRDDDLNDQESGEKDQPWLLRGSAVPSILANMSKQFNHGSELLKEVNRLRMKQGLDPYTNSSKAAQLLRGALLSVRIVMVSRGVPDEMAMIYSLSDQEYKETARGAQNPKASTSDVAMDDASQPPDEDYPHDRIIGYATSGNFSLSRGQGFAIGTVPVTRFLQLLHQARMMNPNHTQKARLFVKVRDINSPHSRAAYLEVLSN